MTMLGTEGEVRLSGFGLAARCAAPIFICASASISAEPAPVIGPAPAWVRDNAIPPISPVAGEQPIQFLLSSSQQRIGRNTSETYARTVTVPQTTAGLQALGNIIIPWNSERSDLTIHHVSIQRGKEVIDLLKGQELTVLRRENNLENSTLDGIRTVVLQSPGLQVGDLIDVAVTVRDRPGTIGAKPEAIIAVVDPFPIGFIERRILIDGDAKVEWKADPSLGPLRKTKVGNLTELSLSRTNYVPAKVPDNAPLRYRAPVIQVSSYSSWPEVVAVMRPLFDAARRPAENSAVLIEADLIAKANTAPEARLLAVLRLTQEKIRYVALSLGEGSHIPASADQTWTRKFGDCKGKVALLLAMLDRLGIVAEPMLTSGQASELLAQRLPSLYAFDHVVVRARVAGRDYILDPTNYGQRTLEELTAPAFAWGLPLIDNASLVELVSAPPSRPLAETSVEWDARKGFDQQVPFTAQLIYRGSTAASFRALQAAAPDRTTLEDYLKKAVPIIAIEHLKVVAIEPDGRQGEFSVRFAGTAPMSWDRGIAGRRYWFDNSIPAWKVDFQRKTGAWKDLPVKLSWPVWLRSTESIILPVKGVGFAFQGQPIDTKAAGTEIKRTTTLAADRATVISDFRRVKSEITAEEARSAASPLDQIDDNVAWIVAPKGYIVSRSEVKALINEPAGDYDSYVARARLLMDQSDQAHALGELGKAIKLDASRSEAPALQAINYFYMGRYAEAHAAMNKAVASNADHADTLRARGLIAWFDGDTALAIRSIDKAIALEPDFSGLYSIRGRMSAGMGRYVEAMADVRRAAELSGGPKSSFIVAQMEAVSGNITNALTTIDKAVTEGNLDDGQLLVLRGDYLTHLGRLAEARTAYRAAKAPVRNFFYKQIKSFSANAVAPNPDIEYALLLETRNYDEAEPLIDRVIRAQRYPSASNLAKRAWLRLMNGKYRAAITDALNALQLDSTSEQAKLSLALAYVHLGKFAEAAKEATLALKVDEYDSTLRYIRAIARAGLNDQAGALEDFTSARRLQFDIDLNPIFFGLKVK